MRLLLPLLLVLGVPARAGVTLEEAFGRASTASSEARKNEAKRRVFPATPTPVSDADALPLLLDAGFEGLRNGLMDVVSVTVSGREWRVGIAPDEGYDDFYLVMSSGGDRLIVPLAPLGRFLSSDGLVVSDEDGPVLRLNARISLLHPINGTRIVAVDAEGAAGKDSFTVGELITALAAKGREFRAGKTGFVLLLGREAVAGGAALAEEETIFIAHDDGVKTRAWALRQSALAPGVPARIVAAGRALVLLKTADGRLVVRDGGVAAKP